MVDELLRSASLVSNRLMQDFTDINSNKVDIRKKLEDKGLLHDYRDLGPTQSYPTSAGIDGSYTMDRMLSSDLVCVAAVAVEGLTPPGPEGRTWPRPRFFSHVEYVSHRDSTSQALRGISAGLELHLAANAPHDVVLIDGSMKTPLIYLNNAAVKIGDLPETLENVFLNGKDSENEDLVRFPDFESVIKGYKEVLRSRKSDHIYAAIPKYTTKNELSEMIGLKKYEEKGVLNFVLKGGEYVGPIMSRGNETLHVSNKLKNKISSETVDNIQKITDEYLPNVVILYFRPSNAIPVQRIEIPNSIFENKNRLRIVLEAIQIQCVSPSIMEPYPLYLADRMVKHLSAALPAIRKAATQEIVGNWNYDSNDIYMALHSYRTESRF